MYVILGFRGLNMLVQAFGHFGGLELGLRSLLENQKRMVFINSEFLNLGQYLLCKV
jgi:hypothetical protein